MLSPRSWFRPARFDNDTRPNAIGNHPSVPLLPIPTNVCYLGASAAIRSAIPDTLWLPLILCLRALRWLFLSYSVLDCTISSFSCLPSAHRVLHLLFPSIKLVPFWIALLWPRVSVLRRSLTPSNLVFRFACCVIASLPSTFNLACARGLTPLFFGLFARFCESVYSCPSLAFLLSSFICRCCC